MIEWSVHKGMELCPECYDLVVNGVVKEWPLCPECGDELTPEVRKDVETGEIRILFWCEGAGDDHFSFEISTGLTNEDVANLEEGKPMRKEVSIELLKRIPDPYEDE